MSDQTISFPADKDLPGNAAETHEERPVVVAGDMFDDGPDGVEAGMFTIRTGSAVDAIVGEEVRDGSLTPILEIVDDEAPFVLMQAQLVVTSEGDLEDEAEEFPLNAVAIGLNVAPAWIVAGENLVAIIPIKRKYLKKTKRMLRPLRDWAATLSPYAVTGILLAAHNDFDDMDEDGHHPHRHGAHFVATLPMAGISAHCPKGVPLDEWLARLAEKAMDDSDDAGFHLDIALTSVKEDKKTTVVGHIVDRDTDGDDETENEGTAELIVEVLIANLGFTPKQRVRERLEVRFEDECVLADDEADYEINAPGANLSEAELIEMLTTPQADQS
ncbi:MAG: hypothetical protein LBM23_10470 [Propionibacteriaceae bacterium]|jgi:hypothetical protein|nr:hypothetical protein [Propionibacteriaceae bacterium]